MIPARATTGSSLEPIMSWAVPRSGTETARSRTPLPPVHTSAATPMVLRNDSASCSSSSSRGMARDRRLPKVRSTASGASLAPYTRLLAKRDSRSRAGR